MLPRLICRTCGGPHLTISCPQRSGPRGPSPPTPPAPAVVGAAQGPGTGQPFTTQDWRSLPGRGVGAGRPGVPSAPASQPRPPMQRAAAQPPAPPCSPHPPPADSHLYAATRALKHAARRGDAAAVRRIAAETKAVDRYFVATLATAFKDLRCRDELTSLWQCIMAESTPLNVEACNCFLKGFKEFDDAARLQQVREEMERQRILPTNITHSILIEFYIAAGRTREAEELFRHMMLQEEGQPSYITFNLLFELLAMEDRWADVAQQYQQLKAKGRLKDSNYNTLMKLYGKAGRCAEMEAALGDMAEAEVPVDSFTYRALFVGYAAAGRMVDVARAKQEAAALNLMDQEAWQTLIWAYCDAGDVAGCRSAAEAMRQAGFVWDAQTYAALLYVYGEGFAMAEVRALWDEMAVAGVARTEEAYAALLHAYCEYGDVGPLRRRLAEAIECCGMTRKIVNAAVEVYSTLGDSNELEALLAPNGPGSISNIAYCRAIKFFKKAQLVEKVRQVRAHMRAGGVAEAGRVLVAVVDAFGACQAWDDLETLYEERSRTMNIMPVALGNAFIAAFFAFHEVEAVRRVLDRLEKDGAEKSPSFYCTLLMGYTDCGLQSEVQSLAEEVEQQPTLLEDPSLLAALIGAGSKFGRPADVDRYWAHCQRLRGPRVKPTMAVLRSWAADGDVGKVQNFLNTAPLEELTPPVVNVLVFALGDLHRFSLIEDLLRRLREAGRPLSIQTYTTLVFVYGLDRNFDMVEQFLGETAAAEMPFSAQLFHALIFVYGKARRWGEVRRYLDRMVTAAGVQPRTILWLAHARCRSRPDPTAIDPIDVQQQYKVPLSVRQEVEVHAYAFGQRREDLLEANSVADPRWLFGVYCRAWMADAAEELKLKHRLQPSANQAKQLIRGFCRAGRVEKAVQELQRLESTQQAVGVYCWSPIICAYCKRLEEEPAERAMLHLSQRGLRPTIYVYNSLMLMYLRLRKAASMEGVYHRMQADDISPNFVTFSILAFVPRFFDGASLETLSATFGSDLSSVHRVQMESIAELDLEDLMDDLDFGMDEER